MDGETAILNETEIILDRSQLTGSISQGKKYTTYEGTGAAHGIEDISLIDQIGDNTIYAKS